MVSISEKKTLWAPTSLKSESSDGFNSIHREALNAYLPSALKIADPIDLEIQCATTPGRAYQQRYLACWLRISRDVGMA
jgi:hypothetical protein